MESFRWRRRKRTFLEMPEAVARHQVKKVLFDGRRLTGDPGTLERFYYGKFAADAVLEFKDRGVAPATQFAYVLKEPVLDPRRFWRNGRSEPGHAGQDLRQSRRRPRMAGNIPSQQVGWRRRLTAAPDPHR